MNSEDIKAELPERLILKRSKGFHVFLKNVYFTDTEAQAIEWVEGVRELWLKESEPGLGKFPRAVIIPADCIEMTEE